MYISGFHCSADPIMQLEVWLIHPMKRRVQNHTANGNAE